MSVSVYTQPETAFSDFQSLPAPPTDNSIGMCVLYKERAATPLRRVSCPLSCVTRHPANPPLPAPGHTENPGVIDKQHKLNILPWSVSPLAAWWLCRTGHVVSAAAGDVVCVRTRVTCTSVCGCRCARCQWFGELIPGDLWEEFSLELNQPTSFDGFFFALFSTLFAPSAEDFPSFVWTGHCFFCYSVVYCSIQCTSRWVDSVFIRLFIQVRFLVDFILPFVQQSILSVCFKVQSK